jgi:hypothetical protein
MKRSIIIKTSLLAMSVVFITITSCKKDYLDINENPNDPANVEIQQLLPAAEAAICHAVGNNLQIFGGLWGQYWTQSPSSSQYKTIEQYSPAANDFDRPWRILYSDALQDLKTIVDKASVENKPNYIAVAKILQAYTFQVLTDNWGDVPFTEALHAEDNILSPHYDSQETVYNGIFQLLSEADALIDETSDFAPSTDDMLLGGDMATWRAFGNTLKLRAYLRLAYVNPTLSQAGVTALASSGAVFLDAGQEVKLNYTSTGGNTNPLYSSIIDLSVIQNLVASSTGTDFMLNNNDPRVEIVYNGNATTGGAIIGIPQGNYELPAGTPVAYPGAAVGGYGEDAASATAPVRLMTGSESFFLQAEAVVRGWMPGDAKALYESGITESLAELGAEDTSANGYAQDSLVAFPATGTPEDQLKAIITQKWAALNGQEGTEGWTEWRRTGYPDFFTPSVTSTIGPGRWPLRLLYPTDELTRNANFPGQKDIWTPVWWDVH